jgi:hypothetical protein
MINKIPKIIHQTGPSNINDWHPLWHPCQQSWKKQFNDWTYQFWNDQDIDDLVRLEYPKYYDMYSKFPVHIMKIDFVRYCIMHSFGGIYADLDYFCYKNFSFDLQKNQVYLLENPYGNDPIENSMMASAPKHDFFIHTMDFALQRWNEVLNNYEELVHNMGTISTDSKYGKILRPYLVFYVSGTNALSTAYRFYNHKESIGILSGWHYNNNDISYHESYYARHIHTGLWGKENIQLNTDNSIIRNIKVSDFDFYHDYSNGKYRMYPGVDWDKNDVFPFPDLKSNYSYS